MSAIIQKIILLSLLFFISSTKANQQTALTFSASDREVRVIEIFSSQGCSSCPPAEKWANKMVSSTHLWDQLFPMVFHVDYWNYLGWRDPYSSADYSNRQRRYKQQSHINAVYTPGFVVNGREWRGWFRRRGIPDARLMKGLLEITLDATQLTAFYQYFEAEQRLNLALLGFDLRNDIIAGENHGLDLEQNFVVLDHQRFTPNQQTNHQDDKQHTPQWQLDWRPERIPAPVFALVAWVDRKNDFTPMQITGSWLPSEHIDKVETALNR